MSPLAPSSRRAGLMLVASFWIGIAGCGAQEKKTESAAPAAKSPAPAGNSAQVVTDITWSVVGLEGAPMAVPPDREKPWMKLETEAKRVTGMGGVNRFGGAYTLEGSALKFGPLMATKMAGPKELNELETRFLDILQRVTGWRLTGANQLELLAGSQVVARFSAQPAMPR